jgi:hypothetical protein
MNKMFYPLQTNILNMFLKQQACMHQIEQFEFDTRAHRHLSDHGHPRNLLRFDQTALDNAPAFEFDYVICTRDDVHFFLPFTIKPVLDFMVINKVDVTAKNCLAWGGINERFQIYTRKAAALMGERLEYYRSTYITRKFFPNTEYFELQQIIAGGFNFTGLLAA